MRRVSPKHVLFGTVLVSIGIFEMLGMPAAAGFILCGLGFSVMLTGL